MDSEIHEYWRRRLEDVCQDRDATLDQLREEISRLQQRCNDLASINAMGRAAVGFDVMNFASDNSIAAPPHFEAVVPLALLNEFLCHYTEGLVPYDRNTKRGRDQQALGHAMLAPRRVHTAPRQMHAPVTQRHEAIPMDSQAAPQSYIQTPAAQAVPLERPTLVDLQQPVAASTSTSSCHRQYVVNRALEQVVKRERGAAMDDEVVQVRPWLFSRVP
jgi:hypothetical protein